MPLDADLYVDRIDLRRYADGPICDVCRVDSFEEFVDRLRGGQLCAGTCPHWTKARVAAFELALQAGAMLPRVPMLEAPRPGAVGLVPLGCPDDRAPVLVTGNSELTQQVLLTVLAHTASAFWLLVVDCGGHTIDMAMVFGTLTAESIAAGVEASELPGDVGGYRFILPGLAGGLQDAVSDRLGAAVDVGPVCAAELPLYLGEAWQPAE